MAENRLKAIGQKPINNIVDITNFVLHEYGQPLHAFDLSEIKGNKIIVKNLPSKTKFTALDNSVIELHEEDLMICDGESNGMCIAGVYGGAQPEWKILQRLSFWKVLISIRKLPDELLPVTDCVQTHHHFEKVGRQLQTALLRAAQFPEWPERSCIEIYNVQSRHLVV